jgi:hypothetical protein
MIHHGGLAHVAKEVKKVYKFMEEEQQRVSVVKILSDDFKSHLKVKYGLSSDELVTMTIQELFPFLSAENTVLNPARFYEQLQYALKDTKVQPWSEVNVFNHQRFYYSQLNFIANFRMLLSIMMTTNSFQAPPADNKEGGLIRLFCDTTDTRYAKMVMSSLKDRRWHTMGSFLEQYQAACLEQFQLSQTARQLPYDSHKLDTSSSAPKPDSKDTDRVSHNSNDVRNPRSNPSGEPWDRAKKVGYQRDQQRSSTQWSKPPNREVSALQMDRLLRMKRRSILASL